MRPVLSMIAACTLFAQQDPVIRLDVQQVLVPVVVTDKKGHHVSGLRAANFRILEDGVAQDIVGFSSDTAASVNDISALTKPAAGANSIAPRTGPRRTFVICIDTLHTAPGNAVRIREALENLFEKEKPSDAQYVLIGIGNRMQVLQPATSNPLEILLKIRGAAFQNLMAGLDSSAMAAQIQNLRRRMDEFCRRCACGARATPHGCEADTESLKQNVDADLERWIGPTNGMLEQFGDVVGELVKLPTSRTLILVSDGFNPDPKSEFYSTVASYLPNAPQFRIDAAASSKEVQIPLRDALKVAADRNVTIYAVDTRGGAAPSLASIGPMDAGAGLGKGGVTSMDGIGRSRTAIGPMNGGLDDTRSSQSPPSAFAESAAMERIARSTGGTYLHDSQDLLKDFRSALADGREYYVLAYVPKNNAHDGKFRQITVETTNSQLNVRAKAGYWAEAAGSAQ